MCQGECREQPDPQASRVLGFAVNARPVTLVPLGIAERLQSTSCSTCRRPTQALVCPGCHRELPPGWLDLDTTSIVMTGAKASGKSVYIAVAIQQLMLLAENLHGICRPLGASSKRIYERDYLGPLRNGLVLDVTAAADPGQGLPLPPPLIFELTVGTTRKVLVIRDLPGENLENASVDPAPFSFVSRADALLFLVDPLQIDEISRLIRGLLPAADKVGSDPVSVLDNLARLLRHGTGGQAVQVPVGVVLSKFDVLQELSEVEHPTWAPVMRNRGAAFQRDPSMKSVVFDRDDAVLLALEVDALLDRLQAKGLLNLLDHTFTHVRVFAVSALGRQPVGERLHGSGIAPFRVLDPLKWVLDGASW
jgi:hypothetical protein